MFLHYLSRHRYINLAFLKTSIIFIQIAYARCQILQVSDS